MQKTRQTMSFFTKPALPLSPICSDWSDEEDWDKVRQKESKHRAREETEYKEEEEQHEKREKDLEEEPIIDPDYYPPSLQYISSYDEVAQAYKQSSTSPRRRGGKQGHRNTGQDERWCRRCRRHRL